MFYFEEINGNKVLKSDLLSEIQHCFTTRGVKPENITKYPLISPVQTHSDNIQIVNSRTEYPNTDGLILTKPKVTVCLRFADCTPIILYDTDKKTGAIIHAGWRGTAQKIGVKTVYKMRAEFSSNPADIVAVIGPAIGLCCYEVSDDVRIQLLSTVEDSTNLTDKNNVDLKRINARQLEEIGVRQIDICPYCTSCNNDLFYSYRKENGTTDRHYAMLQLSEY